MRSRAQRVGVVVATVIVLTASGGGTIVLRAARRLRSDRAIRRLTVYRAAARDLRVYVASAALDVASFERPLAACQAGRCGGMCCSDGAHLIPNEVPVLHTVVARHRSFLITEGAHLDEADLVEAVIGDGEQRPRYKTVTVPRAASAGLTGDESALPSTACILLTDDGRCSLEALAIAEGRHRWFYKPSTCWMHPMVCFELVDGCDVPCVVLPNECTVTGLVGDEPGWSTTTTCGRTVLGGDPGLIVLRRELDFLSAITGRRFVPGRVSAPRRRVDPT